MLSSHILCNNEPFLHWIVMCKKKKKVDCIWQQATTNSVAEPRRSPKALPKAKFASKKRHSHCLVVCHQSDSLQLFESQGNHYIWDVRSANQWDAPKTTNLQLALINKKDQLFFMMMPDPMLHKQHFKDEKIELWSFASSAISTWPLANLLPLLHHLKNFLQGKCFHNQQDTENAFQESIKSWITDFYATGINKLISCWQICVDCNGSYFD